MSNNKFLTARIISNNNTYKEITRLQANSFLIIIKSQDKFYKIFKIIFEKREAGFYVAMPYFKDDEGVIGLCTMPTNLDKANVSFTDKGKTTKNKLKFVYHSSGETHFAQTGKVKTLIKNESIPPSIVEGHIFTIYGRYLHKFETIDQTKLDNLRKEELALIFDLNRIKINAYRIVVRAYDIETIINQIPEGDHHGPIIHAKTPLGEIKETILFGSPKGSPSINKVYMIDFIESHLEGKDEPILIFLGGFGKQNNANAKLKDETFLFLQYPFENHEEWTKKIGSIDLAL